MSSKTNNNVLTPEERYTVAVSWGTIVGSWALMLIICGARVSSIHVTEKDSHR